MLRSKLRHATLLLIATAMLLPLARSGRASEELTLDQLNARFGWDFATAEIKTQKLGEGFYVLFGIGGNIAVSIGDQGTLIVDDQFPQLMPKIEKALEALGSKGVDFVINTHGHFDHADGNKALGPTGSWIISQKNARELMEKGSLINLGIATYRQEPYPPKALPTVTYEDRMRLHFNGEAIDLFHTGPAHTTGDSAVIFRGRNAVHLGDVFNNTGYPFIDVDNGGGIDGMISFCLSVLGQIPEDATVIPGHGEVTDVATLDRYVKMLETVRSRVARMLIEGKSLEEVEAAQLTADFSETFGDVSESMGFIDRVYTSLRQKLD